MSQTLSLEPGKYALFITPPVAGVDFTGTPLPSVSYQWKKNGAAIAGQTNATISGVWVEQSGGTVDLVDGDVISIDIILTNPVSVATKTISATIDSAIPAPVISPVSVRQLSDGTYQTVTSLANTDIGEQVIVASNTGGTITTTPPVLTTYQWRRGYGAIAGATAQTYTLQAADADSIIDCVVTATNAGGTATATATVVVGTVADAGGWTELTPSADSRLIYVSNDGDDVAAANVKGRGYYLPNDPEIGADPTNPAGPIVAYRTAFEACKRVRGWYYNGTDYPGGIPKYGNTPLPGVTGYADWLMLRRNQSYQVEEVPTAWPNNDQFWTVGEMAGGWVQARGLFGPETGGLVGRSVSEPTVITAWGPPSEPRPVYDSFGINRRAPKVAYVSIETPNKLKVGFGVRGEAASDVLLEDLSCAGSYAGNFANNDMMRVRRCTLTGSWSEGDNQGWYEGTMGDSNGDNIVWEECVFDMNGYKEDPNDATTWTRGVAHGVTASPGLGVQPERSVRNRNMYLNRHASVTLRGSIISRTSGAAAVQMREGGVVERNLFLWNVVSLSMVHPQMIPSRHKGALVKDNVVLHDDHMLPPGAWGGGIGNGGVSNTTAVTDGNIIAHFHRGNNGGPSLAVSGKPYYHDPQQPPEKLGQAIIVNNAMYHQYGNDTFLIEGEDRLSVDANVPSGVVSATVSNNAFSTNGYIAMAADTAKPAAFTFSGNKFHSPSGDGLFRWGWEANNNQNFNRLPYSDGGFSQWQAAGYDTDATFTNDFAAFKAAAGWTAPERDILSYMQSVDPTYVVNEDVYVDEFASVAQATRQRVWEVMSSYAFAEQGVISVDRAKEAARRYHAFLTFIDRAKANRKGAWDTRWTAEAVNNYIREGFGKAPVTGPYDNRPIATRIAEYTS